MKNIIIAFFMLILAVSCQDLKYKADTSFMSSAEANAPEYYFLLNGKVCKNDEGKVGMCIRSYKRSEGIKITIPEQQYAYTLEFACTTALGDIAPISVPENQKLDYQFEIPKNISAFNCSLMIFPIDRPQPIGAFGAFRVFLIDDNYRPLEQVTRIDKNNHFVISAGQYAKFIRFNGKSFKEKVLFKDQDGEFIVESNNMRFAYRGIK